MKCRLLMPAALQRSRFVGALRCVAAKSQCLQRLGARGKRSFPAPQVHPTATDSGAFALQFEHPTLAQGPGGWMNRADKIEQEPVEVRAPTFMFIHKHSVESSSWRNSTLAFGPGGWIHRADKVVEKPVEVRQNLESLLKALSSTQIKTFRSCAHNARISRWRHSGAACPPPIMSWR